MIRGIFFTLFLFPILLFAQSITLNWTDDSYMTYGDDSLIVKAFEGAEYLDGSHLPYYRYSKSLSTSDYTNTKYSFALENEKYLEVNNIDEQQLAYISNEFNIIGKAVSSRSTYSLDIIVFPFKLIDNKIYKLISFDLDIRKTANITTKSDITRFVDNSVLVDGNWIKVAVNETGIYQFTYNELSDLGLDPTRVSIFTSLSGPLSTMIDTYSDDLQEIATYDNGSSFLFYAEGQDKWVYNTSTSRYEHNQHPYDNQNYFYLTSDKGSHLQIPLSELIDGESTTNYTTFCDYAAVEPQLESISHTGDDWYSEALYDGQSFSHSFTFDNLVLEPSILDITVAARSISNDHYMKIYADDILQETISLSTTSSSSTAMDAYEATKSYEIVPTSNTITVSMAFECEESTAMSWVDYFYLNVKRELSMTDNQLLFRNIPSDDDIVSYTLSRTTSTTQIWNVSDIFGVKQMVQDSNTGNTISFKSYDDTESQFVAVNIDEEFPSPTVIGTLENQNLHGEETPDMVIVTVDDYMLAAEKLAKIHRDKGMSVLVVDQYKIFNEFSSGKADVTAIRWFMKMFYDRYTDENNLKYLLFFGDADQNNRLYEGHDYPMVMTYESDNSLNPSESYVSDDYFGLLDDTEGDGSNIELLDKVDIGIGRIPIKSLQEGYDVVEKIYNYIYSSKQTAWSNQICFLADDKDQNTHINDADEIAEMVRSANPGFAIKKIYFDAFVREEVNKSYYYPDAKDLSDSYIENGTLIWTYSGHGSPNELADEIITKKNDIVKYSNTDNLPLWLTASCDFCPYDHNDYVSSGESVLLSSIGGGIGLFTTTRLVYSSSNKTITKNFYYNVFSSDPDTGENLCLGDILRLTKNITGTGANKRKFIFIGDPALQLHSAELNKSVETTHVNNIDIDQFSDTLRALDNVTISGSINTNGNIDSTFSGTVYITIYDKINAVQTLANDNSSSGSAQRYFYVWNSILYQGNTVVENGLFTCSFILPKNMDYTFGKGRIEYFAINEDHKINGYNEDIYFGGINEDLVDDTEGPEVTAYMNSSRFVDGGDVSTSPTFMAEISDLSSINTSSNTFGHNMTLTLNNDASTEVVVNSNFFFDSGDLTKGTLSYQFDDLTEGDYTAKLKVWDMQNNSSSTSINFHVADDAMPSISSVYCYPSTTSLSSDEVVRFVVYYEDDITDNDVQLSVLDSEGRIVYQSQDYLVSADNEFYFEWEPKASALPAGLYLYRVTIYNNSNLLQSKSQKLVIEL